MLKIAMVTSCYHPVINGVVRMIELYRQRLTALGHEVTVFTFGPTSAQDENHTVRMSAFPLGKTGYFYRPNIPQKIIARLNQMDIVHCHHLILGPEKLSGKLNCPLIYTNHTRYDLYTANFLPFRKSDRRQRLADRLLARRWPSHTAGCQTVIAPSDNIQQVMCQFGVHAPIQVIRNGIDLNHYADLPKKNTADGPITAVYLGRLSTEKNTPLLLANIFAACQRHPDIQFKLIGSGPLFEQCQLKINTAGLTHRIILTGWVPAEQIPQLLATADFQVTMSVTEVHPLAIIEGMAAGLPAVVLNEPAMAECVGSAAIIAENPDDWVEAVLKMAHSAGLRQKLGIEGQLRAQAYDIDTTVSETIRLYERLITPEP